MTEPIAMTIRHMKIEDYSLVYGLWTRCTGFTMRDIDDCEDAIKTFLKRNPDTCFVTEDDDGRIIGAILAGHDGSRPACRPTHGHVGSGGDAAAQRVHYVAQQPRVKRPLP